ncbi:hypothetical protein CDAR_13891, partial [Caerostris darwini]
MAAMDSSRYELELSCGVHPMYPTKNCRQ